MQYKIPTRVDVGRVRVEFENSYEPNGPFGAKSIGEVVINTPLPAISDAICNAIGTRFYELPITPEKSQMAVAEKRMRSDDRPRGSAIPWRNWTRYFSGGRRRKDNIALCAGPPLFGAGTAGARLHHDPHPASERELRPDEAARDALWQAGTYAVAGGACRRRKLTMPPHLADWMAEADTVLLEADGAKRHPCKAPAAHEPMLLRSSDIVLAAAGLSAVEKPLQDVCFRLEAACTLLAVPPETP